MKITKFAIDKTKSVDGVWVDAGEGLRLKIAYSGNPKFEEMAREVARPYLKQIRRDTLPRDVQRKLNSRCIAKCILLDWDNLEDESGQKIPYSDKKALELLTEHPEFEKLVMEFANDQALFNLETQEDSLGNSSRD